MADGFSQYDPSESALATVDEPADERAKLASRFERKHASGVSSESQQNAELDLQIEFGRTRLSTREALRLRDGSVVELDNRVNDAVEVFVNRQLVARGEVLVLNNCLSVQVTEVISDV